MNINVADGVLKAMKGDYVLYKVDYLLDHLAREVHLLEEYRQMRDQPGKKEETLEMLKRLKEIAERKDHDDKRGDLQRLSSRSQ